MLACRSQLSGNGAFRVFYTDVRRGKEESLNQMEQKLLLTRSPSGALSVRHCFKTANAKKEEERASLRALLEGRRRNGATSTILRGI